HSQIYNELRRMTELGWATMERQEQTARPDKKIYQITAAGEEALRRWHASGPARGLQMRDEVLLRFVFGSFADPAALAATLRAAIADHEQRLAQYEFTLAQCLPPPPGATPAPGAYDPDPFFVETARFGLRLEETYLQWLREALAFAEARIPA
ncbi:MAG TPA: helix-turn-helix transcriptional regulator, partial [Herpetosiphonaceae bacterium]